MVIWLSIPTAIVVQSHLKMLQYTSAGRSKGSNFSNNTLLAVPTFTVKGHLQEGCRKRGITSLRVTILTANKQCATEVEYFDSSSSQTASENLPFYSVLVNTFEQRVTRCFGVTPWCSFWMTRIWPLTGESRYCFPPVCLIFWWSAWAYSPSIVFCPDKKLLLTRETIDSIQETPAVSNTWLNSEQRNQLILWSQHFK